jgi:hypothetical protein
MEYLTPDQLKAKSDAELVTYNQLLMSQKDLITEEQQKIKAELNSRAALSKFHAMPEAEKQAIAQHVQAGNIATRTA